MAAELSPYQQDLLSPFAQVAGELDPLWHTQPGALDTAGCLALVDRYNPDQRHDVLVTLARLYTAFGLADDTATEAAASVLEIPAELKDPMFDLSQRKLAAEDSLASFATLQALDSTLPTTLAKDWGIRVPCRYDIAELQAQAAGRKPNPKNIVMTAVHDHTRTYPRIEQMVPAKLAPQSSAQFYEVGTSTQVSDFLDDHASKNQPAEQLWLVGHGTEEGELLLSPTPGTTELECVDPADLSGLSARGVLTVNGVIALAGCNLAKGGLQSTAAQIARRSGHIVYACEEPVWQAVSRFGQLRFVNNDKRKVVSVFYPRNMWHPKSRKDRKTYAV